MIPSGFLSAKWLWLLVAVLALALAYVGVQLQRRKYVARFSNVALLGSVAPKRPGWRRHLTFALVLLSLLFLTFGLARPSAEAKVPRERATVVVAIDVSLSMEATDVTPSRISVAKAAARQFVDIIPSRINVGLVSFGGSANLLVPPTLDRDSVKRAIAGLQLQESTAIGEAIFTSLQAIQNFAKSTTAQGDTPPPARIVLLSDGSNTVGRSVQSAVDEARKEKVQISTIAFGRPDGTVTYQGRTIPVPADDQTLSAIAQETGGSFHTAASDNELRSVYKDIGSQIGYTTTHKEDSWRWFGLGLISLFAAAGASLLWAGRLV
ncbi:MAG: VWA domain-containing protein [Jatrophihabitans sp.]|uniref:VWA domain-containing protein n=1 Tax=Jatrophihabitans sp. TaxID=1932789 RepID=UPI003F817114